GVRGFLGAERGMTVARGSEGTGGMPEERHYADHHIARVAVDYPQAAVPSHLDEYHFDLNGYLRLPGLLTPDEVADGNARIDAIPKDLPRGCWHGWAQRENHPDHRGV